MKKTVLSAILLLSLSSNLYSMEYEDSNLDSWRDGFITAYKAIKLDTKIQGVQSKVIPTEKYIIYFDANKSDIADWDKVMVQMFGYSLSLNKPVRTSDGYIIFDSFDNKATATQELESLNRKIFKGSEKYSLTLFENTTNKVFYSDTAILMSELDGLKNLLENVNKIELANKKKELEKNQKVALVYVDEKTDKILNLDADIVETDTRTNKQTTVTSKDLKSLPRNKTDFVNQKFFGTPISNSIVAYKKPSKNAVNKSHDVLKGEIIEFGAKNIQGWYKVKDQEIYIPGSSIKIVTDPNIEKKGATLKNIENKIVTTVPVKNEDQTINKNSVVSKEALESKVTEKEKNDNINKFVITSDKVILYKLKNYSPEKNLYGLDDFVIEKAINNDGQRKEYSHIVSDVDGNKFVKLKNENHFVDFKNVHLIK